MISICYAKCGEFAKYLKVLQELTIRDIVSWNALIGEYTKQGQGKKVLDSFKEEVEKKEVWKAQEVFEKFKLSNVVLWTSLIRGYVENGQDKEALIYVQLMQDQGYLDSCIPC